MHAPASASGTVAGSPSAMASNAPRKGATEKYAPVRAVPRWRRPTTNSVKLTP